MNKVPVARDVWRGCVWLLGVGILLWGSTDCRTLNLLDEKEQHTLVRVVSKLLKGLNDAVSQSPDFTTTVTAILKEWQQALDHTQLTAGRVNWFMQCLDNCLHLYDDHHGDRDQMSLLGLPSNMTVELLYKCNHFCVDAGTGGAIVGR